MEYITPEMEIELFDDEDVVKTSLNDTGKEPWDDGFDL